MAWMEICHSPLCLNQWQPWYVRTMTYVQLIRRHQIDLHQRLDGDQCNQTIYNNRLQTVFSNNKSWRTNLNTCVIQKYNIKIFNNLAPEYLKILFQMQTRQLRKQDCIFPNLSIDLNKISLSYSRAVVWNSLPLDCRNAKTLSMFKAELKCYPYPVTRSRTPIIAYIFTFDSFLPPIQTN